MLAKDVLLPLLGEPKKPALAAIEAFVAVAADLGARITALPSRTMLPRGQGLDLARFWRCQPNLAACLMRPMRNSF